MSTPSASTSEASSLSSYTRKLAYPKSSINVNLDNHYNSKVYTSSCPVSGNVTISAQRDVRFDKIEIVLLGQTKTQVDGVSSPHATSHTFLKLIMPIPESTYPVPRILEAGRTYTVPFNFVIPSFLTINACSHRVDSENVRDHHVCLPPTMGSWEKDDLAPHMASVEYCIKGRVYREPDFAGTPVKVMEAMREIQVLPAFPEEAPLNINKSDKLYATSKSKNLKKNILAGKLGKLTVTGDQPTPVVLRSDGLLAENTHAQLNLQFEPASADVLPPKVTSISSKIEAHTFFSSGPITALPNLGDWHRQFSADRRSLYSTSVPLFSTTYDKKTSWVQHVNPQARRDSGYESESGDGSDEGRRQGKTKQRKGPASPIVHTASLLFPVNLPVAKKTFLPSFHTCIASRQYTLAVTVTVATGSTSSTVTLHLPLQVAVEATAVQPPDNELPSFETAVEEAAADEHLRPRLMSVPDVEFQRQMLPGYA